MKKLILFSFFILVAAGLRAEITFSDLSFDAALEQAKKTKKVVMVDYYTDWCGWCKVLDKKTYTDANVGKYANSDFVSLKINAEKGEGIALAKKSKVQGFPTIVFYNENGEEVHRVVGYQEADKFLQSMKIAAANSETSLKRKATN